MNRKRKLPKNSFFAGPIKTALGRGVGALHNQATILTHLIYQSPKLHRDSLTRPGAQADRKLAPQIRRMAVDDRPQTRIPAGRDY